MAVLAHFARLEQASAQKSMLIDRIDRVAAGLTQCVSRQGLHVRIAASPGGKACATLPNMLPACCASSVTRILQQQLPVPLGGPPCLHLGPETSCKLE